MSHPTGHLFWITGYAGAGKTSIAQELAKTLRTRQQVVLVDGDEFRQIVGDGLGHDPEARLQNAWRIARFCRYLTRQGIDVVCATVSLYSEVRTYLRSEIEGYHEIYVKVSDETLMKRDQKGLYSGALRGEVDNVAGVNLQVELPDSADLVIENDTDRDNFAEFVDRILALAESEQR